MKKLLELMVVFCLCVGFARAQSPQAVNFLPRLALGTSTEHFAKQGNDLWLCGSNALIKLNTQTNAQTLYKPDNSDMKGGIFTSLAVDNKGIYATTNEHGFCSFDGISFTNYDTLTTGEVLKSSGSAMLDSAGNVFMSGGLYTSASIYPKFDIVKFNGTSLSRLHVPNMISAYPFFTNFQIDKNNHLFCLGNNKVYIHNGINWDSVPTPPTHRKLMCDTANDIWLLPDNFSSSITNYSFYKWNINHWDSTNITFSSTSNFLLCDATLDNNGNFILCGEDKILKITGNNLSIFNSPPTSISTPSSNQKLSSFIEMPNGDYWCRFKTIIGSYPHTAKDIIWHYDGNNWTSLEVYSDINISLDYVQVDKWDRKWSAGYNGLFLLSGAKWEKINLPIDYDYVIKYYSKLSFDGNGNLVCLLDGSNVSPTAFRYDGINWQLLQTNLSSLSEVAINDAGQILITNGAAGKYFDGNVWQTIDFTAMGWNISSVATDSNGVFWLCSNNAKLIYFDGSNFTVIPGAAGVAGCETMRFDRMGYLWMRSTSATFICRFDGTTKTTFNNNNIPLPIDPNFFVEAGTTDQNGNIFLCTYKGLIKFDGTNWTLYDMTNADFIGTRIRCASIDNANNIWLSDGGGVTVFNESGTPSNITETIIPFYKGNFYFDNNANGIRDANDYGLYCQKAVVLPDSAVCFSNSLGDYSFFLDSGTYNLSALPYLNWQQTSSPQNYPIIVAAQGADNLDFGLKGITDIDSLELHLWGNHSRCDWFNNYFISYQNKGTTPLSGNIILTIDSLENFNSAFPAANVLSPHVYSWHFQNLMPFQSQNISVTVQSPNWQAMGQAINGNVHAICPNINVTTSYSDILTCAYDPNDKTSTPLGEHYLHQIKPNCPLEYLIRFQNTGNDVAFNIAVEDTISPYLDMNTFELLGASHFVETKYSQNGAVRFEFPLIMLPDSNQNEALSHGFVAYRIKPKANVSLPAVIENTAFIYFDQNPAVVTNTTRDTMTQFYLGINAPSPQNELLISPNPFDNQTIVSYSNPYGEGYEVSIYDLSGKLLVRKMDNTGRFSIEKGNLQSGMYLLKVKGRKEMSAKLVVQ